MKRVQDVVRDWAGKHYYTLVRSNASHRKSWMDHVTAVKGEKELLLNHCEACQIISAVTATEKLGGHLAEVGVAYGASAKLIAKYAGARSLHLFDTFEGLPDIAQIDGDKFHKGQFRSNVDVVKKYVDHPQAHYYKGLFPSTADPVRDLRFSFVHLDVDLYESTIAGLRFFYPRLLTGGILISHDFLSAEGVNAAFSEFFADKPEPVIELTGYQCMIVKTGAA